jgi:hypothetical protein
MSILAMAGHMLMTCLGLLMVFLLVTLMLGLRSRVLSFNKGQIIGMIVDGCRGMFGTARVDRNLLYQGLLTYIAAIEQLYELHCD